MQTFGWNPHNLMENRCVTTALPSSPLRSSYNPSGTIFNFGLSPPIDSPSYESQLLHRLQALSGYTPPTFYTYSLPQAMPFLPASLYGQSILNNNYTLQPPPHKNINPPQVAAVRNSYPENPAADIMISPNRNSEPVQLPSTPQYQTNPVFQFSVPSQQKFQQETSKLPAQYQSTQQYADRQKTQNLASGVQGVNIGESQYQRPHQNTNQSAFQSVPQTQMKNSSDSGHNQSVTNLQVLQRQQKEKSPIPKSSEDKEGTQFIKPLPQMGTLTTTDSAGRVRLVVPVPSDGTDVTAELLANLKFGNTLRPSNGPAITRTTSERVPNRSELMSQVQRTVWARHTTK